MFLNQRIQYPCFKSFVAPVCEDALARSRNMTGASECPKMLAQSTAVVVGYGILPAGTLCQKAYGVGDMAVPLRSRCRVGHFRRAFADLFSEVSSRPIPRSGLDKFGEG